jgi:hypothetical protein
VDDENDPLDQKELPNARATMSTARESASGRSSKSLTCILGLRRVRNEAVQMLVDLFRRMRAPPT